MKKIFLLLFISFPFFSSAQQDHFEYYNCINSVPNDNGAEVFAIYINPQNQPIAIGSPSTFSNTVISKLINGTWVQLVTCPFQSMNSCVDSDFNIWISDDNGGGVYKFNGSNLTFEFPSFDQLLGMTYDKDDSLLWSVDYSGGFHSYNPFTSQLDTITSVSLIQMDGTSQILYYNHKIYISSGGNVDQYDIATGSEFLINPANYGGIFSKVSVDKNGFIYYSDALFSGYVIYKFDPISLTGATFYASNTNIADPPSLVFDSENNIWLFNDYFEQIDSNAIVLTSINFYLPFSSTDYYPAIELFQPLAIDSSGAIWGRCAIDANGFLNLNACVFRYSSNGFSNILGKIYYDQNLNGNYNAGETLLSNQIVYSNQSSYANSDDSGEYYLKFIDSTLTYNVQPIIPNYWQCQSNCSYTVTPSVQLISNYDFGLTPTGNFDDVNVTVTGTPSRPGFVSTQNLLVKNEGTTTNNPVLTYQFDAQQNFVNAIPTPTSVTGNTLSWNLNSLTPFQQQNIQLWFSLPSSIAIGTPLTSIASVQGSGTENTPADNIDSLNQIVVGSFDPNEKTVSPMGNINSGDWLTYTVYFQNTGTDTAFNVTVLDTLDSDLDFSTINIVGFSHPITWQIKGAGYLKFSFNDILLPDSNTNEALSHGYVCYRIKSKTGLQNGTHINNTASIYFDFNSSVVTNTTSTIIGSVGIATLNENSFSIFLTIISSGETIQIINGKIGDQLKLIDCTGRILSIEKIISSSTQLQTKNLSAGIYFVQCGSTTRKLVVQ